MKDKIELVKEIVPYLQEEVIEGLLRKYGGSVEKATNAALELTPSSPQNTVQTNSNTDSDIITTMLKGGSNGSLTDSAPFTSSPEGKAIRGTPMVLPSNFLPPPDYRRHRLGFKNDMIEFSVTYRRQNSSLGLSINDIEGEIVIVAIENNSPGGAKCLALASGVEVGDTLVGINQDSTFIETDTQDIIELIAKSGTFITMHFQRRFNFIEKLDAATLHPAVGYLSYQNILEPKQFLSVDRILKQLKRQWLGFSEELVTERIVKWRLDEVLQEYWDDLVSADLPKPLSASGRRASYSAKKEEPNLRSTNRRYSTSGALQLDIRQSLLSQEFNETKSMEYIRPALVLHMLRAEQEKGVSSYEETVCVMYCCDVKSGSEWLVRRKIKDILALRRKLIKARHAVQANPFPPPPKNKSVGINTIESEIFPQLKKFFREVMSLYYVNLMHPSSIRIALLMQDFMGVKEYMVQIKALERQMQHRHTRSVQVFIHHVMHTKAVKSVVSGFVDDFAASKAKDATVTWTEESALLVVNLLKKFIDNMQVFLTTTFRADCAEIVSTMCEKGQNLQGRSSEVLRAVSSIAFQENSTTTMTDEDRINMIRIMEEEIEEIIRTAIRRQIELEVYVSCMGRVKFVLHRAFEAKEKKLWEKVQILSPQPQSYFDITLQHISPCSWFPIVTAFQDIKNIALPCDRILHLQQLATSIPTLYRAEHPQSDQTLGADDLFPIFIYIVVQSQLRNLWIISQEMQLLCDPERAFSEAGYYLATLHAVLHHILGVNLKLERPFDSQKK